MRKAVITIIIILLSFIGYYLIFSIPGDEAKLAQGIKNHFNKGRYKQYKIDSVLVKRSIDIGNKKVVLILVDNDQAIGRAVLQKGINNRFRVLHAFYGNAKLNAQVLKVKGKNYWILSGENNLNIKYVVVTYGKKSMRAEIPGDDYFMTYIPFPSDLQGNTSADFIFYDVNGKVVSRQ